MKKFLVLFLSMVIVISLIACAKQPAEEPLQTGDDTTSATTTATTTTAAVTKKDGIPQKPLGDSFSGDNGEPPITVIFDSVQDIKPFIEAANGTEAKFEEYAEKADLYYIINQKVAQAMAHNMEIMSFPVISSELTDENSYAIYYLERNELNIIYTVGEARYCFVYRYSQNSIPIIDSASQPLVKQNVQLGDYMLDLYEGSECLVGHFLDGQIAVQVVINAPEYSSVSLDAFSMVPVASVK